MNTVYNNPTDYTGTPFIIATVFFAFQIYCDFSGYSDIAIGAAQIMGFRLMDNFNRPYFSKSIPEFWRRWYISLSTWFKDYLYIPLGGNRVSVPRWYLNLFIVFVVSGLWHGANWTFVVWGALHGLYFIFGLITKSLREAIIKRIKLNQFSRLHSLVRIAITFTLVNVGWVFFRANSISDAWYIFSNIFRNLSLNIPEMFIGMGWFKFVYYAGIIGFMEGIHLMQEHIRMRQFMSNKPIAVRWFVYLTIIIFILLFGVFNNTPFIYFQF